MQPEYWEDITRMCGLLYPAGLNIDYECNPYDPRWDFENWGAQYLRPETPASS